MIKLFFSYSHRDEGLRNELEVHLSSLKRQGIIETWYDRRIDAGDDVHGEISENLENADIILLLVSPYFIASDYCYDVEMTRAIERHRNKDAIVIPIILHPCDWQDLPFGCFRASPKDGLPISKHPNIYDAFLEIVKDIKNVVKKIAPIPLTEQQMANTQIPPHEKRPIIQSYRSSNLRIKKKFSDKEKDTFLSDAFEYIANYFEGSLKELENRNDNIETNYRRIDANQITAKIYIKGTENSQCRIFMSTRDYPSGILYSSGGMGNGYNESLSVKDDGYTMYLKPMGIRIYGSDRVKQLTFEGAAEYYWEMLIEHLQ